MFKGSRGNAGPVLSSLKSPERAAFAFHGAKGQGPSIVAKTSRGLETNLERRSGPRIRTISGCAFFGVTFLTFKDSINAMYSETAIDFFSF